MQFGYDAQHSGSNAAEKGYSTSGNRFLYEVSGGSNEPLYLSGVSTADGSKDLLFSTMGNGSVMALDAASGALVWQVTLSGTAQRMRGTPALDPNRQFLYSMGMDGKAHRLRVGDGTEIVDANWPEIVSVKPDIEQSTSALTIVQDHFGHTYLVAVSGSYGDGGDYQGHVTSIDLSSGTQNTFNALCSNLSFHFVENGSPGVTDCNYPAFTQGGKFGMAGMWAAAGAVYDNATNKIYVSTGNGPFDANSGGYDWGDTLLALNPDATGSGMGWPLDSYTPSTYATLYAQDYDLGIESPSILPSTSANYPHLAFQVGKDFCGRLIDLDNMSGAGGPGHVGGELNASCYTFMAAFPPTNVWVDPDDGSTRVFSGYTEERLTFDGAGRPSFTPTWTNSISFDNGGVYANRTLYGFSNLHIVYAINASDGSTVWSYTVPGADVYGVKWDYPIAVNGHLYIPIYDTGEFKLLAFELDGVFKNGLD